MEQVKLRDKYFDYVDNIYMPISQGFLTDAFEQDILNITDDNAKIDYLYALLEKIVTAKSHSDFIFLSNNYIIRDEGVSEYDFSDYSKELFEHQLWVQSEIAILEAKTGRRFRRLDAVTTLNKTLKKDLPKNKSVLSEPQTAAFFSLLSDKEIISSDLHKKNIALHVSSLTGYSEEGIRQKLSNVVLSNSEKEGLLHILKSMIESVEASKK